MRNGDKQHDWLKELRATGALSLPLALAQLGHIAINTTDILMIGRLGPGALASAALGGALYFAVMLFGVGIVSVVAALAAQAHGGRKPRDVRRVVRQGLWVATCFCLPALVVMAFAEPFLLLLHQPVAAARGAAIYMDALMWALPPTLWFIVLRGFMSALGRPRPVLWVMLSGVAVNVILDYALIFGHFGAPKLGVLGAGIASALVNAAMFLGLLWIAVRSRPFRRYAILARLWRADWPRFIQIARLGAPVGITLLLEIALFTAALFLMGLIGTVEIAAHQIAIQTAAVTFMVPLGISHAAVVRVGQAYGRGDVDGIVRAAWVALGLSTVFMSAMAVIFWLAPRQIVGLFLDLGTPENRAVVEVAISLVMVAAVFQIVDGAQAVAMAVLRGVNDTRTPMYLAAIGYWGIGFGGSALLGFGLGMGAVGIWIGLALGLATVSIMALARFHWRDRFLPSLAAAH